MEEKEQLKNELLREYQEITMLEDKLEQDILLGNISDELFSEMEQTNILFKKQQITAKLFEMLLPDFEDMQKLSEEIMCVLENGNSDLESREFARERYYEFTKLCKQILDCNYYNNEDLQDIEKELNVANSYLKEGDREKALDSVVSARILSNLSKIPTYEQYEDMKNLLNKVVLNLRSKLEALKTKELGEE